MDSMVYWIWLSLACSPGSTTFGKLIKEFADAREIYEAPDKAISTTIGYRTSDRSALLDKNLDNDYVGSALANIKSYNVSGSMTAQLGKGTYKVAFYLRNSAKQGAQLANQIEYVNGYNVVYEFTVQ